MADVLSQNEVDKLLEAVSGGGGDDLGGGGDSGGGGGGGGGDIGDLLTPEKKKKKSKIIQANYDKDIVVYDFKRPNRVSTEQMRALSSLHEQFARNLAAELTGVLRTVIDIQASQAEQLTYQEFIMSLPNPTSITTLSCEPLTGEMILELNPSICFPFIDKLLGGHSALTTPERAFTDIEMRIISQVVDHIVHHLQETWAPIANLRFSVADTETNPQIMQNVAPNEIVVLLTFEVRMDEGEVSGMLNLCIPFNVIEPIMGSLSSQSWFMERSKSGPEDSERVKENLQDVPMLMEAFIAESVISVQQLAEMQPGDVIITPKLASHKLLVNVGGKPKFRASMGKVRGHKAVKIESNAKENEIINF